jgi:hypothetical protein
MKFTFFSDANNLGSLDGADVADLAAPQVDQYRPRDVRDSVSRVNPQDTRSLIIAGLLPDTFVAEAI